MATTTVAWDLPDQPPSGVVERFALGGDGFRSPSGVYVIRNVAQTGDGTGAGGMITEVTLDPSYVSLVAYLTVGVSQATPTDMTVKFKLLGPRTPTQSEHVLVQSFNQAFPTIAHTWLPPAFPIGGEDPPVLGITVPQVGTDIATFQAAIFLYDIRARENFPIDLLVAARGGI